MLGVAARCSKLQLPACSPSADCGRSSGASGAHRVAAPVSVCYLNPRLINRFSPASLIPRRACLSVLVDEDCQGDARLHRRAPPACTHDPGGARPGGGARAAGDGPAAHQVRHGSRERRVVEEHRSRRCCKSLSPSSLTQLTDAPLLVLPFIPFSLVTPSSLITPFPDPSLNPP